jgi:PHD/YefM family antitoxin component YafN of YafNO toxin-antitoxin module
MFNTNFTSIREVQRNYKKISEEVNKTNTPTIVMSNNKPQFAIVSLKTLQTLEQKKQNNSLQGLVEIAHWVKEHNVAIPADLGPKHNEYTWD